MRTPVRAYATALNVFLSELDSCSSFCFTQGQSSGAGPPFTLPQLLSHYFYGARPINHRKRTRGNRKNNSAGPD